MATDGSHVSKHVHRVLPVTPALLSLNDSKMIVK